MPLGGGETNPRIGDLRIEKPPYRASARGERYVTLSKISLSRCRYDVSMPPSERFLGAWGPPALILVRAHCPCSIH